MTRAVGGDFHHVQLVDFPEFLFFGHGGTGHTGQLFVQTEEVLEGDGGQGLAFVGNLHAFLGLDGLMEALVIAAAIHETAGEFVNDK